MIVENELSPQEICTELGLCDATKAWGKIFILFLYDLIITPPLLVEHLEHELLSEQIRFWDSAALNKMGNSMRFEALNRGNSMRLTYGI